MAFIDFHEKFICFKLGNIAMSSPKSWIMNGLKLRQGYNYEFFGTLCSFAILQNYDNVILQFIIIMQKRQKLHNVYV